MNESPFSIEEIKSKSTKDSTVVKVSGRVDSNTSPQLDTALQIHAEGGHNIVLNVHEVDYMSSAGIRALVSAYRTLWRQWSLAFRIGAMNRAAGCRPSSLATLLRVAREHYRGNATDPTAD